MRFRFAAGAALLLATWLAAPPLRAAAADVAWVEVGADVATTVQLLVGGVFVAISGLVYFAFMAAWLNLFLVLGELRAVTLGAGLLAVALGAVNARDGLRATGAATLAIPESAKPGLFARMRGRCAPSASRRCSSRPLRSRWRCSGWRSV